MQYLFDKARNVPEQDDDDCDATYPLPKKSKNQDESTFRNLVTPELAAEFNEWCVEYLKQRKDIIAKISDKDLARAWKNAHPGNYFHERTFFSNGHANLHDCERRWLPAAAATARAAVAIAAVMAAAAAISVSVKLEPRLGNLDLKLEATVGRQPR